MTVWPGDRPQLSLPPLTDPGTVERGRESGAGSSLFVRVLSLEFRQQNTRQTTRDRRVRGGTRYQRIRPIH